MLNLESETVEFKRTITEGIKKDIIAFANTAGGMIYVGIDDDGQVLGVNDVDGLTLQIANMVRDSIKPDITTCIHYDTRELEGKQVLAIEIQRGVNRPYYLAKKGLRPEGVYVRQGTASAPATESAIKMMIKETSGDSFEDARSLEQNLTFDTVKKEFALRNVAFGAPQLRTLGLIDTDGTYTNLALLLSDSCPYSIKLATFLGKNQEQFQDRREISGSLFKQIVECYEYLDLRNERSATFEGLYRTDKRNYPPEALREALMNAVVHRDYSYSASIQVSVYSDRIEILSVGGLLPGIKLEDVLLGLSICRNPHLANIFYRLDLIEAYGTGLKKITDAYAGIDQKPQFLVTGNAFKTVLPNRSFTSGEKVSAPSTASTKTNNKEREGTILSLAQQYGSITRQQAEGALGLGQTAVGNLLKQMVQEGALSKIGAGRSTHYALAK